MGSTVCRFVRGSQWRCTVRRCSQTRAAFGSAWTFNASWLMSPSQRDTPDLVTHMRSGIPGARSVGHLAPSCPRPAPSGLSCARCCWVPSGDRWVDASKGVCLSHEVSAGAFFFLRFPLPMALWSLLRMRRSGPLSERVWVTAAGLPPIGN